MTTSHSLRVSQRLETLKVSSIRKNMRLAAELGAINMAQGRPDFPAASAVKLAAISAILSDENQYSVTWGLSELREAVAEMLMARYGMEVNGAQHVTITCGVTEAMVDALLALVSPGDEVVVIEPAHENYVPAIRFAGGLPKFVTLEPPAFALDPDSLEAAVSDKTRLIIFNSPHNPSGRVFTHEELQGVARVAQRYGLLVLTDEIYDRLTYDGHRHVPLATFDGMRERTITTGGISKIHCVTGWRLGYAVASEPLTDAIRLVHDYTTVCAPTPLQRAAVCALAQPESYYTNLLEEYDVRRLKMMETLEASGLVAARPEGAYYVLASFDGWRFDADADKFADYLIHNAGVATVPGTAFYYDRPAVGARLIRFAFAKSLEVLDEVQARLVAAFDRVGRR